MKHGRGFLLQLLLYLIKFMGILPERGGIMKIPIADDQVDVLNA